MEGPESMHNNKGYLICWEKNPYFFDNIRYAEANLKTCDYRAMNSDLKPRNCKNEVVVWSDLELPWSVEVYKQPASFQRVLSSCLSILMSLKLCTDCNGRKWWRALKNHEVERFLWWKIPKYISFVRKMNCQKHTKRSRQPRLVFYSRMNLMYWCTSSKSKFNVFQNNCSAEKKADIPGLQRPVNKVNWKPDQYVCWQWVAFKRENRFYSLATWNKTQK